MAAGKSVKTRPRCRIAGVITTLSELRSARRMLHRPDLFELRLDYLAAVPEELTGEVSQLRRPLILTARDPAEGGANNLPFKKRWELLARFLPKARYVDVELHSLDRYRSLLDRAQERGIGRIISFHDFHSTPKSRSLHAKLAAARAHGADIFKVVVRTDRPAQLAGLLQFMADAKDQVPLSVMGVGKLGSISRLIFAAGGSVLSYGWVGQARVEGQLSVAQLQTAFQLFKIR